MASVLQNRLDHGYKQMAQEAPVHRTPSRSVPPVASSGTGPVTPHSSFKIAQAGEQLETNYSVHELPESSGMEPEECQLINQALLTCIELLESEKKMDSKNDKQFFRMPTA